MEVTLKKEYFIGMFDVPGSSFWYIANFWQFDLGQILAKDFVISIVLFYFMLT